MERKGIGVVAVVVLVAAGWFMVSRVPKNDVVTSNPSDQAVAGVTSIDSLQFDEIAADPEVFVLDVHIPEQTHIEGTDAFVPYDELAAHIDTLPADKSTPIVVYCRSGSMSKQAAVELADMGYTTVYDLVGGVQAYRETHASVYLQPSLHEFGTVIYGDVVTTEMVLTNFTPTPLTVTRITTSCGCTSATVDSETVGAYESTVVTISFDPAVHKDDTDLGDIRRTIYIETDNPNFSNIEGEITATVVKKS